MKKRTLPRNIDGRTKIGFIPIKSFFMILPIIILIAMLVFKNFNPFTLFLGFILIAFVCALVSETSFKETGLDILKDIIRYKVEGEITFERSCDNIEPYKRCIRNKIKR